MNKKYLYLDLIKDNSTFIFEYKNNKYFIVDDDSKIQKHIKYDIEYDFILFVKNHFSSYIDFIDLKNNTVYYFSINDDKRILLKEISEIYNDDFFHKIKNAYYQKILKKRIRRIKNV